MTFRTTTMLFFVLGRAFLFLIDTQHCFRLNNLPPGLALSSSPTSPHYVYRDSVCITRTRKFSAQSLPFPHRIGSILWCRHGRWRSFTFRELSGPSGRQAGRQAFTARLSKTKTRQGFLGPGRAIDHVHCEPTDDKTETALSYTGIDQERKEARGQADRQVTRATSKLARLGPPAYL